MPSCITVTADGGCSFSCARCALNFALNRSQWGSSAREIAVSDAIAAAIIQKKIRTCESSREHIRSALGQYGDLIFSRWRKKSKEKREAILLQASPYMPYHAHHNARLNCGLPTSIDKLTDPLAVKSSTCTALSQPYFNVETLREDPSSLFGLLYHRSNSKLEDWVPYDLSKIELLCSQVDSRTFFSMACVATRGKRFGRLVSYDADECHALNIVGFPMAFAVFDCQAELLASLCRIVDEIIGPDPTQTGDDRWNSVISTGFKLSAGSQRWSNFASAFSSPPVFNPVECLEEVQAHLVAAEDRMVYLQTDPEYLYNAVYIQIDMYPGKLKRIMSASDNTCWDRLAGVILYKSTADVRYLRWLVTQCKHVVNINHEAAEQHGQAQLLSSERYKGSVTALYTLASAMCRSAKDELRNTLIRSPEFSTRQGSLSEVIARIQAPIKCSEIMQWWRSDRLRWYLAMLGVMPIRLMSTDEAVLLTELDEYLEKASVKERSRVTGPIHDVLTKMAILQKIETSIALSNSYVVPAARLTPKDLAKITVHMPGVDTTLEPRRPTTAESKRLGAALREFYAHPWPKGTRDASWLSKSTKTRACMARYWAIGREIYRTAIIKPEYPKPWLIDPLSCLDADTAPEHLAKIEAERAEVLQRMAKQTVRSAAVKTVAHAQTFWGDASHDSKLKPAVDRVKPKTRPAEPIVQESSEVQVEPLTADFAALSTRIAVSAESLRMFARLFATTGTERSKGNVKWQQVVTALADAGLVGTNVGGSAVNFKLSSGDSQGSIVFHKPHPEPNVDLVEQLHMGKRLQRWFGWTAETFVERKRLIADDNVAEKEEVTETED